MGRIHLAAFSGNEVDTTVRRADDGWPSCGEMRDQRTWRRSKVGLQLMARASSSLQNKKYPLPELFAKEIGLPAGLIGSVT